MPLRSTAGHLSALCLRIQQQQRGLNVAGLSVVLSCFCALSLFPVARAWPDCAWTVWLCCTDLFCCCVLVLQASQEKALRASQGRADKQRKEQEALGLLLTEREAAVLDQEQALKAAVRCVLLRGASVRCDGRQLI